MNITQNIISAQTNEYNGYNDTCNKNRLFNKTIVSKIIEQMSIEDFKNFQKIVKDLKYSKICEIIYKLINKKCVQKQ